MIDEKQYSDLKSLADQHKAVLVAVSKVQPIEKIQALYDFGHRDFGENRVSELIKKVPHLPKDIRWHFIGNLQSKKVKELIPLPYLVHSVDRTKLLRVIQKESEKNNVNTKLLIQVKISKEESKSGFDFPGASKAISDLLNQKYPNLQLKGLMAMASLTDDEEVIASEFKGLESFFNVEKEKSPQHREALEILSTGMSGDYLQALDAGSNMLRIGSAVFGPRDY